MTIKEDFQIGPLLWYKIGGKVKYFLECESREDILEAIDFIAKNNVKKIFVCGQGSNLIFTDDYFDGAVIRIVQNDKAIRVDDNGVVEVFAGVPFDDVIQFTFDHGLVGLEWAGGLPGTVGAAVRGNAGAFGGETKDTLISVDVLDYSGDAPAMKTLTKEELQFVYRGSLVKTNKKMIVVTVRFGLKKAQGEDIEAARKTYQLNGTFRKERHPLEYPNCGSVFKNLRSPSQIEKVLSVYPDLTEDVEKRWYGKVAVASLIERLGLKGYRIGDAQVSEKHALFIVNLGNARAKDVLEIINTIQQKFQETFGFQLEVEVEIVK